MLSYFLAIFWLRFCGNIIYYILPYNFPLMCLRFKILLCRETKEVNKSLGLCGAEKKVIISKVLYLSTLSLLFYVTFKDKFILRIPQNAPSNYI